MKSFFILGAAAGAVLLSTTAMAQEQRQQQGNILEQLLGSVFGTNQQASEQTLETDWNQGGGHSLSVGRRWSNASTAQCAMAR